MQLKSSRKKKSFFKMLAEILKFARKFV